MRTGGPAGWPGPRVGAAPPLQCGGAPLQAPAAALRLPRGGQPASAGLPFLADVQQFLRCPMPAKRWPHCSMSVSVPCCTSHSHTCSPFPVIRWAACSSIHVPRWLTNLGALSADQQDKSGVPAPHLLAFQAAIDGPLSAGQQCQASHGTSHQPNGAECLQISLCALGWPRGCRHVFPNAGGARIPRPSVVQENIPGAARVPAHTVAHQAAAADRVGAPAPLAAAAAALIHPAVILGDDYKVLINACCCIIP